MVGIYKTFKNSSPQIWGTEGGLILFVQALSLKTDTSFNCVREERFWGEVPRKILGQQLTDRPMYLAMIVE